MLNNQFRRGELYFVITGTASTALARALQKSFREKNIPISVEQWSVLVHLWKKDGVSQQELCKLTSRDKPSMTRLLDNLEKLEIITRRNTENDRRINEIMLTKIGRALKEITTKLANDVLIEGLNGCTEEEISIAKNVLTKVFDNSNRLITQQQ